MTQPAKLTIDIYSDVMCPWCVIGYSQLNKALGELAERARASVKRPSRKVAAKPRKKRA